MVRKRRRDADAIPESLNIAIVLATNALAEVALRPLSTEVLTEIEERRTELGTFLRQAEAAAALPVSRLA